MQFYAIEQPLSFCKYALSIFIFIIYTMSQWIATLHSNRFVSLHDSIYTSSIVLDIYTFFFFFFFLHYESLDQVIQSFKEPEI
jgi:hypothetical protein